jgi:hypothetical protein
MGNWAGPVNAGWPIAGPQHRLGAPCAAETGRKSKCTKKKTHDLRAAAYWLPISRRAVHCLFRLPPRASFRSSPDTASAPLRCGARLEMGLLTVYVLMYAWLLQLL